MGTASKPTDPRVVCLGLTLLLFQVCTQIVLSNILMLARVRLPFRASSVPAGALVRPAIYTIIEDIVAVDGGQHRLFRELLNERYEKSVHIRQLLLRLDWLWGVSGLAVAIATICLIFLLPNVDAAWIFGWTVPWVASFYPLPPLKASNFLDRSGLRCALSSRSSQPSRL